jgi:hypothetical protein
MSRKKCGANGGNEEEISHEFHELFDKNLGLDLFDSVWTTDDPDDTD